MLLEAFVNRYRNPWVAPLHFATIVLPLMMVFGAVLCLVGTPTVIILAVLDFPREIFSPKLAMVCALAGGGLMLAPLAIGAIHGQIREKQRGIEREGYGAKMMAYLMVLGLALPFPVIFGAKFFYNYPFARYPSYILEVKPSPELKAEIERFGLAEIKWHTPYDYSLDRQVIRYDFGEPVDGDWTSYRSKRSIFEEAISQMNREVVDRIATPAPSQFITRDFGYPAVFQVANGRVCALRIEIGEIDVPFLEYTRDDEKRKVPFVMDGQPIEGSVLLNLSSLFRDYRKETAFGVNESEYSCAMKSFRGPDYLFFVSKVFFPALYENIYSYQEIIRLEWNFSLGQAIAAIRSL